MNKKTGFTIYGAYVVCIIILAFCWFGALYLKEKTTIEFKIRQWDPATVSLVDLGFTPEKISAKHIEVDKQIISWQDFSYLVVSSFYPQSYSAAMFIYGPGIHGETDLKSILILSNGLEGLVIDKIPHIIKVVDINEDNSPELVVDIGSYTEYYEQYTILTLENDSLRLVFNEWIDKDKDTQQMVNKGPIVFIEGGNEAGTMNFEIDVENHCVKVYRGLAPQSKDEDWQWTSVIYELQPIEHQFVFKSME